MDIYEPVIAELKAQIEECQRVIALLEMMRSKGTGTAMPPEGIPGAPQQKQPEAFSGDAFFGMTIGDAARKYLKTTKKTATAKVIAQALLDGGLKTAAKNFVENLRSILSRNSNFVLVNGQFGLMEWYPGLKSPLKRVPLVEGRDHSVTDHNPIEDVLDPPSLTSSEPVRP